MHNKRGYYEDKRWQAINFRVCGVRYDYRELAVCPPVEAAQYEALATECRVAWLWGMKDPRLCFTVQHIMPFLADVGFVIVQRYQAVCAESLFAHSYRNENGHYALTHEQADVVIFEWMQAWERRIAQFPDVPRMVVQYEYALAAPLETAVRLAEFCGEGLESVAKLDPEAGAAFLDAGLNHHG